MQGVQIDSVEHVSDDSVTTESGGKVGKVEKTQLSLDDEWKLMADLFKLQIPASSP